MRQLLKVPAVHVHVHSRTEQVITYNKLMYSNSLFHYKIHWSRCQFGEAVSCTNVLNNVAEMDVTVSPNCILMYVARDQLYMLYAL